ncbi:hypothetical protein AAKU58_004407, partial [Oxalobacteraceae bacterium GrIS 1.18]
AHTRRSTKNQSMTAFKAEPTLLLFSHLTAFHIAAVEITLFAAVKI